MFVIQELDKDGWTLPLNECTALQVCDAEFLQSEEGQDPVLFGKSLAFAAIQPSHLQSAHLLCFEPTSFFILFKLFLVQVPSRLCVVIWPLNTGRGGPTGYNRANTWRFCSQTSRISSHRTQLSILSGTQGISTSSSFPLLCLALVQRPKNTASWAATGRMVTAVLLGVLARFSSPSKMHSF